jgi:acetyl-CoA carboxylase alpha subunit
VVGEGGNEAAIAFGVADRIIMMENAILSPISPEGAAALLYRDTSRANEVAESLRLTASDCMELGIVDGVVPEPDDGAHADPAAAARHLERALLHNLSLLEQQKIKQLLKDRYKKFRRMGEYSSRFKALMVKEAELLSGYLADRVRRVRHRKENELEEEEEGIPE